MTSTPNPIGSKRDTQPRSAMKSARPWADWFANTTPSDGITYPCASADGALRKIDAMSTATTRTQMRMTFPSRPRRGQHKQSPCLPGQPPRLAHRSAGLEIHNPQADVGGLPRFLELLF